MLYSIPRWLNRGAFGMLLNPCVSAKRRCDINPAVLPCATATEKAFQRSRGRTQAQNAEDAATTSQDRPHMSPAAGGHPRPMPAAARAFGPRRPGGPGRPSDAGCIAASGATRLSFAPSYCCRSYQVSAMDQGPQNFLSAYRCIRFIAAQPAETNFCFPP